jgi:hypothetical protein
MARCDTLPARQQPAERIGEQAMLNACRDGRRLSAAAMPRATGQVRHPRIGAADGARAWDQLVASEGVLAQNRDHRRLGRQLHRRRHAMAEALAALGDANQVTETEVPTHVRQHLGGQVRQVGAWRHREVSK